MTAEQKAQEVSEDMIRRSYGLDVKENESAVEGKKYLTFVAASDNPYTVVREIAPGIKANVVEVTDFDGLDTYRLDRQMPLLDNHNDKSTDSIIGKIVEYRKIKRGDDSTALEVKAEFDMSIPESRKAFEKAIAGLITNASIGYQAKMPGGIEIKPREIGDDFDLTNDIAADVRLKRWEIGECSFVCVPADPSVGFEKQFSESFTKAYQGTKAYDTLLAKSTAMMENSGATNMTEQIQTEEAAVEEKAVEEIKEEAEGKEGLEQITEVAAEQPAPAEQAETKAAITKFTKSGSAYIAKNAFEMVKAGADEGFVKSLADKADKGMGMSQAQVKAELWDHIQSKDDVMKDIGRGQAPAFHQKDARHNFFDFDRLAKQLMKGADTIDGRERELIQEHKNSYQAHKAPGLYHPEKSVMIPMTAYGEDPYMRRMVNGWHQRAYNVGATPGAAPGADVGHAHQVFDESWFTAALVNQATVLPYIKFMPSEQAQDLVGVTESGSITTGFIATENATRSESAGLTFGNRALRWKMAYGRKDFSTRILDQTRYLFGTALDRLRRDLTRRIDQEVVLGDSNTDGGFQGIVTFTTNDLTGADGERLAYDSMTELMSTVESANANAMNGKFIMPPRTKGWLRAIQRQAGATGAANDVIITDQLGDSYIDGAKVLTSNWAGLKDITLDSKSHDQVIFGDLDEITGAYFSGTEMVIDTSSGIETGVTKVFIRLALDIQPDHTAAFAKGRYRNVA